MEVFLAGSWTGFMVVVVRKERRTANVVCCGWNEDSGTLKYTIAELILHSDRTSNLIFASHVCLTRAASPSPSSRPRDLSSLRMALSFSGSPVAQRRCLHPMHATLGAAEPESRPGTVGS